MHVLFLLRAAVAVHIFDDVSEWNGITMGWDSYGPSVVFLLSIGEVLVVQEHWINKCSFQSKSCQRCSNQCSVMGPDTVHLGTFPR